MMETLFQLIATGAYAFAIAGVWWLLVVLLLGYTLFPGEENKEVRGTFAIIVAVVCALFGIVGWYNGYAKLNDLPEIATSAEEGSGNP
jgi:predicted secreted protein